MNRRRQATRPTRHFRLEPALDRLEGRALMAFAGSLDPTFGGGAGASYIPIASSATNGLPALEIQQVQVESDGSIVAAGGGTVVSGVETLGVLRLNADGTPSTAFGTNGQAFAALPSGVNAHTGGPGPGVSLAVQAGTGDILVSSPANVPDGFGSVVAMFNPNGTPDTAFGTDGVLVLDEATIKAAIGGSAYFSFAAFQPDGKIALAGTASIPMTTPDSETEEPAVARLTSTGSLDTSLAGTGVELVGSVPPADYASGAAYENPVGLTIQANGQVVVMTTYRDFNDTAHLNNGTAALIRLNADGSRDTSLSQAGIQATGISTLTIAEPNGLIAESNGSFLVLGAGKVSTINADGSLGKVSALPAGNQADGIAPLPGGEVAVLAGGTTVARLTANLTPDPTFGVGGIATVVNELPPPPSSIRNTFSLALLAAGPDGRIVVAGSNPSSNRFGPLFATTDVVTRLTATGTSARAGDFNGDGIADPAIYLPSLDAFAIADSSGKTPGEVVPFGVPGPGNTIPAPGNYYGTGQEDIAAYLPTLGVYAVADPTGKTPGMAVAIGTPGAGRTIPAPGDYYGTGRDDIAVYVAASGAFAIVDPTGKTPGEVIPFGIAGVGQSIPVPGDYDGSGKTEVAVYLPSYGAYAYRPADGGPDVAVQLGMPGFGNSIPMPGDYDGSGHTEMAVYFPSLGVLAYRPASGGADVIIPFGVIGAGQSLPAPGDYTGSGRTDPAVYLPAFGTLAYRPPTGPDVIIPFGIPGAGRTIPVTSVVLSPFPGSGPRVSAFAIEADGILGEPDALDFVPVLASKRAREAGQSA